MRIAIVNAGSSSLKLSVLDGDDTVLDDRSVDAPEGRFPDEALGAFLASAEGVAAVGHRVVHGGAKYRSAVRLDGDVLEALDELVAVAPLHNPPAVRAIRAAAAAAPDVVGVACFDTAFHATIPPAAFTYAVPRAWSEDWGVRRFGFHGLSHAWCTRRAGELLGRPLAGLRLVTCHLGAGASLAAVVDGRSVDTTMGFTPLEGLVMANRSGSVDPGAVLWVQQEHGLHAAEVERLLNHDAGLLALAGTADLREVLAAAGRGDDRAGLAVDVYVHRLCREIGAMVASAGGLDALVFTGGVGEHAPVIRARCAARLAHLGAALDEASNEAHAGGDADLTGAGADVSVLVVEAREDVEIARQTRQVIRG